MDWLGIVIIASILVSLINGYRRGIVQQVFDIIGIFAALYLAYVNYEYLYRSIELFAEINPLWGRVLSFALIFFGVMMIVAVIVRVWRKIANFTSLSVVDGLIGSGFAGLKCTLFISIILLIMISLPIQAVNDIVYNSEVASSLVEFIPAIYSSIERFLPENIKGFFIGPQGLEIRRSADPHYVGSA